MASQYVITASKYGKSGVRLLHVERGTSGDGRETARELEVTTRLELDNKKRDYISGDNRDIIATDSQKNIIYVLAKKYGVKSPEEFGLRATEFFLSQYPKVCRVEVTVSEVPWRRHMTSGGEEHQHAFIHSREVERWASVTQDRTGKPPQVRAGLRKLRVLKTTKSSFVDFVTDAYRTLPDAEDRIFSTIVGAQWTYSSHIGIDFSAAWSCVLDSILEKFAGPKEGLMSPSVQNTLYLASCLALNRVPQISWISMEMPNCHYLNLDLGRFPKAMVGEEENRTVFLPIDKPSGYIYLELSRADLKARI